MRHQSKILTFLLCEILLSPVLAGCPAGPTYDGQKAYRTCETDEQCLTGEACSDQGYCLPMVQPQSSIGIELVPTDSQKDAQDGFVQVEFGPDELSFDESGVLLVHYEAPVTISGSVSVPAAPLSSQGFTQFQTRVTFRRASRIPGRPRVSYSSSLSFDMTNAPVDGIAVLQYSLTVPDGFSYEARAVPEGGYEAVVPPSADIELDARQSGQSLQQNFDFSEDDFRSAEGLVTDAMGLPLSGVEVQLVDNEGRRISTIGKTGPSEGSFRILFSRHLPPLEKYTLLLAPSSSTDMLLPTLEIPVELGNSDDLVFDPIAYPPLRTERCSFRFRIMGQSSSGTNEPVAGAKVSFSTEFPYDGEGIASHSVEGVTDPDGSLSVQLISGANAEAREYRVAVLPSVDSPYAAAVKRVDISGCGGTASTIQLSERTQIVGTVLSATIGPVANLTVLAKPIVNTTERDEPSPASMLIESGHAPSATTTQNGNFYINLDPGSYNFELAPATGSPLPRWLVTGISVDEENPTKTLQISMPSPGVLRGKIQAPPDIPMAGFVVRAYLIPQQNDDNDWTDSSQTAFLLSEAPVRSDGTFSLVLPANL